MKGSTTYAIPRASLLLSILLLSISYCCCTTTSESVVDVDAFLQCLPNNPIPPSYPISSAIYTPDNSSFTPTLQSYIRNLRFMTPTTPKPLLIVAALHESHVQGTVLCAKKHGFQIRIRSGGHDYEGLSYVSDVPFVLLDLFNLRSIDIDMATESAWVQSGATIGEVYYRIAEKSKVHAFPAGVCYTLGAGGHLTGGGYGTMMRKYGLSVDNIIDAQVVDVNGKILDRKSMGEDLFWAIKGGGAASFGVVLSWKINLVPVPATVTSFRLERTLEQGATDLVYRWQQVADKLDDGLFIRLMLQSVDGNREGTKKTIRASFVALFLGQKESLVQLMSKSFPELGLQVKDCNESSWVESTLMWADYAVGTPLDVLLNRVPKSQTFLKRKSDYLKEPIEKADLELIWKKMMEVGKVGMVWNPYGGKMSEISESETPFPHRAGNICKIQYSVNWKETDVEATNRYLNMTRELFGFMTPYVSKSPREAFLNYRDIDVGTNSNGSSDFGLRYFKNNFDRLVRVKTAVDPDDFFKNEQSIPTLHTWRNNNNNNKY